MRPSQIIEALNTLVKIKSPVMIHGSPGVGKSDVVRQVAEDNKMEMVDLRLSQLDPVDLRGVPSVKNGITTWNPPDYLPTKGRGILFLDEINSAAQATQAAAYQLVLDRQIGEYVLPEGWSVVAAGNRTTDRAIVNTMSTALRNRFVHLNFEVNVDDWTEWAVRSGIHTSVISFIRFRPTTLNEFEARNSSEEERKRMQAMKDAQAFATPRSWEFMSNVLNVGTSPEFEFELFSGIVGESAAAEFAGYLKYYRDLPNIDMLLMNPKKAPVPEEPASLYAISTTLAARANVENMNLVLQYCERIPEEFQVLLMKDAICRDSGVCESKAFTEWAAKNARLMY